jgi:prepilin-type N-terminal cleavage/methylation domain-containing protein
MRKDKRGFTLIEIIATLALIGVLSTVAVLFMGNVLTGFTAVKNNSAAALKAQMALNRLSLELKDMSSLNSLPTFNVSITYNNSLGDNRKIKFDGLSKCIYISTAADYILIDGVSNFSLSVTYDNMYNIAADDVAYIDIGFTVSGVSDSFSTRIFPRNRIVHP